MELVETHKTLKNIPQGYQKTSIGIIPADWSESTLGQVGDVKMCKRIFNHQTSLRGEVPFYKIGTFGKEPDAFINRAIFEDYKRKYSFPKKGSVLISASGTIGRTVVFKGEDAYFQDSNIIWLDNNESLISNEYLLHVLKVIHYNTEGSTIQRLYGNIVKSAKFPLPPTLTEQKAIATALSDVDALIASLDRLIKKKKAFKQGVMQELLTGKRRLEGFKDSWKTKPLGKLADLYQPMTISQDQFSDDGYPVYGANGIVGYFRMYNHEEEQVLITCRGSTCGMVNFSKPLSWITGNAMVVNVDGSKEVDKLFLYYLLSSKDFSGCITGSGQPQIVRKPLHEFQIVLPSSIKEQSAIAEVIDTISKEIDALRIKKAKCDIIKQGMMQELLTGKTRLV